MQGYSSYRLRVAVDPPRAAELAAAIASFEYVAYELQMPVGDESLLDGLRDLAMPADSLELRWGSARVWIRARCHDGVVREDGTIGGIVLTFGDPDLELVIETVLDHADRADVEAWLTERAGAPVIYVQPPDA